MSDTTTEQTVEQRVTALEERVDFLEKERPGRRPTPVVESTPGVCGLDPTCDSSTCEKASIYRYQKGCQGDRCVQINRAYYANYRKDRRNTKTVEVEAE